MKAILMKSPNGGHRISTGRRLPSNKASNTEPGLHLIELLVKAVPWKSSNNPGSCPDNWCSQQQQVPLLKTQLTQLIDHGGGAGAYRAFTPNF